MKKGCLISLIAVLVLVLAFVLMVKLAFGPSHRTISLSLENGNTLIGEETYNADFAEVFYDVYFKLINSTDTLSLGRATFHDENWKDNIRMEKVGHWFVLPVKDGAYAKVLMANQYSNRKEDTTLSPLDLRYDSLWVEKYHEVPVYLYVGSSTIDSIRNNAIFVNHNYRIGYSEDYSLYNQMIEYELEPKTGVLNTKKIFERIKK